LSTPTAEQIRTLAPDAAAARAGEELANLRKWATTGRTDGAAWGLCQGSGSSPYQVAVDLAGLAYKCSCPSRKIPCKHALALMFLVADAKAPTGQAPLWAQAWLDTRSARAAEDASREPKAAADPEARAKRAESRERKVAAGIEELDRWLADLARRGLDAARGEGHRFWDAMGARLVDAQAPGLGRQVRALGSAASQGQTWPPLLLDGAARLHLASTAYGRLAELPGPLAADVRGVVGWTVREEDLPAEEEVEDRWLVVGWRLDDSGQVMTARTFLVGESTGRPALHLSFGVNAAPPTVLAAAGQAFRARLAFYPSATPLRVAVRQVVTFDNGFRAVPGSRTVAQVLAAHADRLAANPFLDRWPEVIGPVVPALGEGRLIVVDASGDGLPVEPRAAAPLLLAVSGGRPVTLCAEWDGAVLRPLSVMGDEGLVPVDIPDSGPAAPHGDESWSRLVSAALLGTERAGAALPIPPEAVSLALEGDREAALLTAAAVASLRLRAGHLALAGSADLPAPAPDDPRPPLPAAVGSLLRRIAEDRRALLPEALALARPTGRRLPHDALPALLAVVAADRSLAADAALLGGPRAAWLTDHVDELAGATTPAVEADLGERFEAASGRARADVVAAIRAQDPVRARLLVREWLPGSAGDERADVVAALRTGLGAADESLLADLLADRRQDVRRAAADLLARLPGSAFAGTVERIARPLLSGGGFLRASVSVRLPDPDPALDVAAFAGKAPQGWGAGAWHLRWLLAQVPPARWTEWLRAPAGDLVDRVLRTDEARAVLAGWTEAASRFSDAGMAAALLADPKVAAATGSAEAAPLLALPAAERAAVAAQVASALDPAVLAVVAAAIPAPWPEPLASRVLAVLRRASGEAWPDQHVHTLIRAAAGGLDPRRADDLAEAASHDGRVRPSLEDAVDLIRFRERLHAAFADIPATPA
jgi:hypothetical protein